MERKVADEGDYCGLTLSEDTIGTLDPISGNQSLCDLVSLPEEKMETCSHPIYWLYLVDYIGCKQ